MYHTSERDKHRAVFKIFSDIHRFPGRMFGTVYKVSANTLRLFGIVRKHRRPASQYCVCSGSSGDLQVMRSGKQLRLRRAKVLKAHRVQPIDLGL